ncbi:MAG TPA: ribonuclease P protein component [Myxococcales bacterium]|nr:ribonuclease P protein component [Myxococcales bacterium]HAN31761.1 ribonuclease P protein component [Myxococcales bacterium]
MLDRTYTAIGLFGRRHRIRKSTEFKRVFKFGHRAHGDRLRIVAAVPSNPSRQHSRLGLAISKKSGNAPRRARIRRLLREAFRGLRSDFTRPVDLVVTSNGPWPEASMQQMQSALKDLLDRLDWANLHAPPKRRRRRGPRRQRS